MRSPEATLLPIGRATYRDLSNAGKTAMCHHTCCIGYKSASAWAKSASPSHLMDPRGRCIAWLYGVCYRRQCVHPKCRSVASFTGHGFGLHGSFGRRRFSGGRDAESVVCIRRKCRVLRLDSFPAP